MGVKAPCSCGVPTHHARMAAQAEHSCHRYYRGVLECNCSHSALRCPFVTPPMCTHSCPPLHAPPLARVDLLRRMGYKRARRLAEQAGVCKGSAQPGGVFRRDGRGGRCLLGVFRRQRRWEDPLRRSSTHALSIGIEPLVPVSLPVRLRTISPRALLCSAPD